MVVLIGVLAGALLHTLLRVQEQAEKAVFEMTVRSLSHALRIHAYRTWGQALTAGEEAQLLATNPVFWLEAPMPGYIGESAPGQPTWLPAGGWGYDRTGQELLYRPRLQRHLAIAGNGESIRLHIVCDCLTLPGGNKRVAALRLAPVVPLRWFETHYP